MVKVSRNERFLLNPNPAIEKIGANPNLSTIYTNHIEASKRYT
jgi:hypothetical protein